MLLGNHRSVELTAQGFDMARFKLYKYQKEGVRLIERFGGRVLLADQMGLGKTPQTLWALRRNPDWLPALIVCPAGLKYHWQSAAKYQAGLDSIVCESRTPPVYNGRDFATMPPLTIINYDILKRWLPYLKMLGFNSLVLEECHYLTNPVAARTKACRSLSLGVDRLIAISGTPLRNRPKELWPVLNMLWPESYSSFWSFAQTYCRPKLERWGWTYPGAENLDQLNKELRQHGMIRRLKSDVLKDLPPKVHRIVLCELSNRKEYEHATNDFIGWLRKNKAHKVRKAKRALAITRFGHLQRLVGRGKMKAVVDWATQFLSDTDEKLVLMATHKKAIECLQRRIPFKSVVIDGSTPLSQRHRCVHAFQTDPGTRLFIGNIEAAGVGLTLTAASEMGLVEWAHRPGDIHQATDRIHRISQDKPVFINYFAAGDTIEVPWCKRIMEKQDSIGKVLDGGTLDDTFDIYEELMALLRN